MHLQYSSQQKIIHFLEKKNQYTVQCLILVLDLAGQGW